MNARFCVALVLICASTAVANAMTEVQADGTYTQAATGMTYPVAVDDFKRHKIIRYKNDGTDESTGYNRETPLTEISMTVYVFPSPSLVSVGSPQYVIDDAREHLCRGQFEAIQHEILNAHPDAVMVSEGSATLTQGAATYNGHQSFYTDTNSNFFGRKNVSSRSDVYMFCYAGGKWTVEYRVDYPANYDATGPIANFMRDLVWTIPLEH